MTGAEQARLSESRYGQSSRPRARTAASGRPSPSSRHAADPRTPSGAPSRSDGIAAYAAKRRKKGAGRILRVALVTVLLAVVGVGTAAALYLADINSRLGEGISDDLRQQLVSVDPQEPFYMLLLGVDKSEGRSEEWGDSTANFRSDTIILARVDPPAQKVALVSIPRDTLVDMGSHGEQKINAAYSYGGAAYMVEVVSEFAGVDISHYAEIDFEQFTSIVDTIGGIEVTLPVAVSDMEYAGIDLPAGTQTLNGEQALGLVRSRHAYDEYGAGDFYRAANQRMVIGAIVKKVLRLDVGTMATTVSELADSITTDFSATDILSLAMQFRNFDVENNMYSGQTPTTSEYINSVWYEIPIESEWREMMERVANGEPPYSDASQDQTAGIAGSIGGEGAAGAEEDVDESTATFSGSVLVLNGTNVSGLASSNANALTKKGFQASAENASTRGYTTTVIVYNSSRSSSARSAALGVAQTIGADESAVSENDGSYSENYDVVVVLGTDLAT